MRKFQPFVHVNQHKIKENMKNGSDLPVLTCKTDSNSIRYAHEVVILGQDGKPAARIVTDGNPKSCGARVWIEYFGEVELLTR